MTNDNIRTESTRITILIIYIGIAVLVGMFLRSICFLIIGENVTIKMRKKLYMEILKKNIGWFDDRENNSSVLTTAMASETSLINGACTDSVGPYMEGFISLFGGVGISLYYNWKMSLIVLAMTPLIILG